MADQITNVTPSSLASFAGIVDGEPAMWPLLSVQVHPSLHWFWKLGPLTRFSVVADWDSAEVSESVSRKDLCVSTNTAARWN